MVIRWCRARVILHPQKNYRRSSVTGSILREYCNCRWQKRSARNLKNFLRFFLRRKIDKTVDSRIAESGSSTTIALLAVRPHAQRTRYDFLFYSTIYVTDANFVCHCVLARKATPGWRRIEKVVGKRKEMVSLRITVNGKQKATTASCKWQWLRLRQ